MTKNTETSASTRAATYKFTASERRAARLEEITNKQGELKREAAERRAHRAGGQDGQAPDAVKPAA